MRIIGLVLTATLLAVSGCGVPRELKVAFSGYREVVAADHVVASEAGAEILRKGGNAVDAAVATAFALSVVRPQSCGIGGGGFMIIHLPADPAHGLVSTAIDFRETCPAGVGPEFFERRPASASRHGGAAVAVPGTVAGMLYALEKYGTMDREQVLAPAIRAAQRGFEPDAHYLDSLAAVREKFESDEALAAAYSVLWDVYYKRGRTIKQPGQAKALRLISKHGAAGFYQGPVAAAMIDATQRTGGVLTPDDLASYRVREVAPLRVRFRGYDILTMPPPSSGGVALGQILGLLERKHIERYTTLAIGHEAGGGGGWPTITSVHLMIEAMKHAFADRARFMGDPAFVHVPVDDLLADAYLADLALRIDFERVQPIDRYGHLGAPPALMPDDGGTSHFCVVDAWGGAVSCTYTINTEFGALVCAGEFDFPLNNEMDDFTTRRGEANLFKLVQSDLNLPEPGKRPLSSMTPCIALDEHGQVAALAGASGGPRIISATAQVLLAMLLGATPDQAVSMTRVHHQWSPDEVLVEAVDPDSLREAGMKQVAAATGAPGPAPWEPRLQEFGHTTRAVQFIAAVQAIQRQENGRWRAASDPRKGGKPAGR